MKKGKKLLLLILAAVIAVGMVPLQGAAASRSLDARERDDYLKPGPSPMDAPAANVSLRTGGDLTAKDTEILLDGTWQMAPKGSAASRLQSFVVTSDSAVQEAEKAFDGKWSTDSDGWISDDAAADHWVAVDMAEEVEANKFVIKHFPGELVTTDFEIQGSNNGLNWNTVKAVTGNTQEETVILLDDPVKYRYFRLYITKPNDAMRPGVEGEAVSPEINYALGKPVTTNSDSLAGEGMAAENLTNGKWMETVGGAWVTDCAVINDGGSNAWARIDLGARAKIDKINVYNIMDPNDPGLNTADFILSGSNDGANWTQIRSVTGNTQDICSLTLDQPVEYRYIRIDVLKPHADASAAGNNHLRIQEIQVIGKETASYVNAAFGKKVTTNSDTLKDSGMAAENLTDGKWENQVGDAWVTDCAVTGDGKAPWAVIDLGKTLRVDRLRLYNISADPWVASQKELNTQAFTISGSTDGQMWTPLASETTNSKAICDYKLSSPGEYRYIKLEVTKPHAQESAAGNNHLRVYELEVLQETSGTPAEIKDNTARIREFQLFFSETKYTDYAKGCSVTTNCESLFDESHLTNGVTSGQEQGAWVSDFAKKTGDSAYAVIDLGEERSFERLKVSHVGVDGIGASKPDLNTADFSILCSKDNKKWDEIGSETGNTKNFNVYQMPADSAYRYIKMDITKPHSDGSPEGNNHLRVYEIEALTGKEVETNLSEHSDSDEWTDAIPADVPGSVHTALIANGQLDDPYYALNDEQAREASFQDYWFRTTFNMAPENMGKVMLKFEGICESGTVYLNGKELGSHVGMFGGPDFDISDKVLEGENTLIVHLNQAPNRKRKPGEMPTFFGGGNPWLNLGWVDTVVFNNTFGWHYANIPPLGIWQSVKLDITPEVEIKNPFIATKTTGGTMDFCVDLAGESGVNGVLKGKISPKNFAGESYTFEYPVSSSNTEENVRLQFDIPDPQLWWPNGLGEQNLYYLEIAFEDADGNTLDYEKESFGIRTLEMEPAGADGTPENEGLYNWKFIVNGKATFLKGTGWCTIDALMRFDRGHYDKFLSLAKDEHVQMLRAWGSGMVETDEFYDLCDEYGITVLQEWPTAWDSYVYQPEDALMETVERNVVRLRNRPSLFMWGGGNEGGAPLEGSGAYDPTVLNKMGKRTIELDGTRPWHRQDPYGGSRHDYTASWGGQNPSSNMTLEAIFWGEFGVDCFPNYESIAKYTPEEELDKLAEKEGTDEWAINPNGVISYHTPMFNTSGDLYRQIQHVEHFLPLDSLENAVLGGQIAQAVGVRYTLERARTRFPDATGALMYKLNDPYPAASWSTVDWYGSPKYAHYVVQDAFAPLAAIARLDAVNYNGRPLDIPIYLVDDADELKGKEWTVRARVYNSAAEIVKEESYTGNDGIGNVRKVGTLGLSAAQTDSAPLYIVTEIVKDGELAGRNFYFINYEAVQGCLFEMPKTTLEYSVENNVYTITNTGDNPAINVHFDCADVSTTFRPEDNYFWLEPGESKEVRVNSTQGVKGITSWNYAVQDDTPPSIPANVKASAIDNRTVELAWDASSDDESGIMNYQVYRDGTKIATVRGTETSYTDTGLNELTTYGYQVEAVNNGLKTSEKSEKVSVKTPADQTGPKVKKVEVEGIDTVTVQFDEQVDQASAENVSNYQAAGGISVLSVRLGPARDKVTITLSGMEPDKKYELAISGVTDNSKAKNVMEEYKTDIGFGLYGHWKFEEGTGTAFADSSGYHMDGEVKGPQWTQEEGRNALRFGNDEDEVALIPSSDIDVGDGMTVTSWIRADSARTAPNNMHIIVAKGTKTTGHFETYIAGDGTLHFYSPDLTTSTGGIGDFGSGAVVDDGTWHNVAVTLGPAGTVSRQAEEKTLRFYVDGVMAKQETAVGRIQNADAPLAIGRMVKPEGGVVFPFNGAIGEVQIYNRSISEKELNKIAGRTVPLTGIEITPARLSISPGREFQFAVHMQPEGATEEPALTYASDNEAVAVIDGNGLLKAIKNGKANITVETEDKRFKAAAEVEVKPVPATEVRLNMNSAVMTEGDTGQLIATVIPEEALDQTVVWSSNNEAVAAVDKDGLVTAVKAGQTTIRAVVNNTGIDGRAPVYAECSITVNAKQGVPDGLVTGLAVTSETDRVAVGKTLQLKAEVTPDTAKDKGIRWTSENAAIAAVDENGLVTGAAAGEVKIYAETMDGSSLKAYRILRVYDETKGQGGPGSESGKPRTGDATNLWLMILLLAAAGGTIVAVSVFLRKRKTN